MVDLQIQYACTVPIRRNLTGNAFAKGNGTDTEQVREREHNGNRTGTEQVQNRCRTDTKRKWNVYGTVTNYKKWKKYSPERKL